jgi:phage-related holin
MRAGVAVMAFVAGFLCGWFTLAAVCLVWLVVWEMGNL